MGWVGEKGRFRQLLRADIASRRNIYESDDRDGGSSLGVDELLMTRRLTA